MSASSIDSRTWLRHKLEAPLIQNAIIALVIVNAVLLGLETSPGVMATAGAAISTLDRTILAIFVIEITLRLYVHRSAFWRDPWSVFDFSVVAIALVPATGSLAVLRALRVLRVLRLLTMMPSMRRVVAALLAAIPGLGSIAFVLLIVYYVFAVIATNLFASTYPNWFGSIGNSLYTLFQIMTLESWSMGIARPVMEQFPYAWLFFVVFILIATFTMLNLFVAIIVNAMQSVHEDERNSESNPVEHMCKHLDAELHLLRSEIRQLREGLVVRHADSTKVIPKLRK